MVRGKVWREFIYSVKSVVDYDYFAFGCGLVSASISCILAMTSLGRPGCGPHFPDNSLLQPLA